MKKIRNFLGGKTNLDKILEVLANSSRGQKYTILHWAAKNNRSDIFEVLKPYIKSAHINCKKARWGRTPLHLAVKANNVEMIKYLLDCGADVNVLDNFGTPKCSPIAYAKSTEVILMLVKAGADIESEQGKQSLATAMVNFAEERDTKSLEKLLSHEPLKKVINVAAYTNQYNGKLTMLEVAAWQGDIETLKILSKYGANANLKMMGGKVILHNIARNYTEEKDQAEKNNIKDIMILLILLFNTDLTMKDDNGKTPLDYLKNPNLLNSIKRLHSDYKGRDYGVTKDFNPKPHNNLIKELENTVKLRDNINKTYGTKATDFILQYLEKNQGKSIEDCVKHLSGNLNQSVNESPNKKSKVSPTFDDLEVEDITKKIKSM